VVDTGVIIVRGAREHNLRDVDVDVPKRCVTVVCGVSGSGKSSLIFDTVAAEAQRQLNETFTAFVRNRLPRHGRPEADEIDGLSTPVLIDQRRLGGNARSTVATVTDLHAMLRLLFSRAGRPRLEPSNALSFNDPAGMCPTCSGIGTLVQLDLDAFLDRSRSLAGGALRHPAFKVGSWYWRLYAHSGLFDLDKRLEDYSQQEWQTLLHGSGTKVELQAPSGPTVRSDFEGLVDKFNRLYLAKDAGELSDRKQATLERFTTRAPCPICGGQRLNERALACRIDGRNIADWTALSVEQLIAVVDRVDGPVAAPLTTPIAERLRRMAAMDLGYLTLDRETTTLSGGESQRIKMVRHLSSALVDLMYVFDEPSVGLHPRDVDKLTRLLGELRDRGNTVLVVEHDPDVIAAADHVIELGPGAGADGGTLVFQGTVAELATASTRTATALDRPPTISDHVRTPTGHVTVEHANLHNLCDVTVAFPLGVLTVVSGVAGSGKSTLVHGALLPRLSDAAVVDQSAIRASIRSTPATFLGVLDPIRRAFAHATGADAALFSFNSRGACPECRGLGITYTDLAFLDPVRTTCERCGGRRFTADILRLTHDGASIADVLDMTATDALDHFATETTIVARLRALNDVGLDYLRLGQPLDSLSGGERQRIKLAAELHAGRRTLILDEPTTGLHPTDTGRLLDLLDHLVDHGATAIVIEHDLTVIAHADWIIDLGPEGGDHGGAICFRGTPRELLNARNSHTANHLRRSLAAHDGHRPHRASRRPR
jgi:excinuclease UvrABC ATPase subunit